MTDHRTGDAATDRVLETIADDDLASRYPEGTHFISAGHPEQAHLATHALFGGSPVVIVYPDGHEFVVTPEQTRGLLGVVLLIATFVLSRRRRRSAESNLPGDLKLQLPPGVTIEARDSRGYPIAA